MTRILSAMILAAGFGTRMGALTQTRPKPLLTVGGRPMIDLALDLVAEAGADTAVVNLHYLGDQIRAHLSERTAPAIAFSPEDPILDTGGGVVQALRLLTGEAFFTLNSDSIFAGPNPLGTLAGAWQPDRMDALLLMVPVGQTRAYTRAGDFFLDPATGLPERRGAADSAPFVYAGAQIIARKALTGAPDGAFSMNLIWDRLLAERRLRAVSYPGLWVDVGTPEGLAEADAILAQSPA
ncbi:MAG: nucleotidyltransferase family protein [Pseudomonadota bacterium]